MEGIMDFVGKSADQMDYCGFIQSYACSGRKDTASSGIFTI